MKILAFDFECSKIPNHMPYSKEFYVTVGCFIPSWTRVPEVFWFDHITKIPTANSVDKIQALVKEADVLAAHNIKYDATILDYLGVKSENTEWYCTQVAEFLISGQNFGELRFNLSDVCERRGMPRKLDVVKTEYWDKGIDTYNIPEHLLDEYVLDDTQKVVSLIAKQAPDLKSLRKVFSVQMEFTKSLTDMEINGLKWDSEKATQIIENYSNKYQKRTLELLEYAEDKRLNLASSQQLSAFLYGGTTKVSWEDWEIVEYKTKPYCKYHEKTFTEEINVTGMGFVPLPNTKMAKDGVYSTSKDTIAQLKCKTKEQRRIKKILEELSSIKKAVESLSGKGPTAGMVKKVQPDGRVHPKLNQTIARSGRLTSSDPNGQNLPNKGASPIKNCVVPRHDGIMEADLGQVEWRAAAELSQDEVMIHEVNTGVDQHAATCVDLMEQELTPEGRQGAKPFNFRMIFGGTPYGYYMDRTMPRFPLKKWERVVTNFQNKYHRLFEWHDEIIAHVYSSGGSLEIPTGRRFQFVLERLKDGSQGYKDRPIRNRPVQGISGGDILPLACLVIRNGMVRYNFRSKMILTVHDSIIFDYIKDEEGPLARMCVEVFNNLPNYIKHYFKMDWRTNLTGEIKVGPNYGALKDYEV